MTSLAEAHDDDPELAARRRVGHDIRGSLAVISGQCEMLESGAWGPLTEPQKRALAKVRKHVDLVSERVDTLTGKR